MLIRAERASVTGCRPPALVSVLACYGLVAAVECGRHQGCAAGWPKTLKMLNLYLI